MTHHGDPRGSESRNEYRGLFVRAKANIDVPYSHFPDSFLSWQSSQI